MLKYVVAAGGARRWVLMKSKRTDYASSAEWLADVKKNDFWLSELQALQNSTPDDLSNIRERAVRKLGRGLTFEFWDSKHDVARVVELVWEEDSLSLPKLMMQTIGMLMLEWLEQHAGCIQNVPNQLKSEEAEKIKKRLVDAELLTNDWKPNKLSGTERALVAREVCVKLKINNVWQVFGQLWNEKPETLRSYLNKALDQKKSSEFLEKLKNTLY